MKQSESSIPPLGQLEISVLQYLWSVASADVHETHAVLGKKRGISPNTIGSTMERLYQKKLLRREKVSHSYRYSAALDKESFQARRVMDAIGDVRQLGKSGLLAAFVDLVADSDLALSELERLVKAKRKGSKP